MIRKVAVSPLSAGVMGNFIQVTLRWHLRGDPHLIKVNIMYIFILQAIKDTKYYSSVKNIYQAVALRSTVSDQFCLILFPCFLKARSIWDILDRFAHLDSAKFCTLFYCAISA